MPLSGDIVVLAITAPDLGGKVGWYGNPDKVAVAVGRFKSVERCKRITSGRDADEF